MLASCLQPPFILLAYTHFLISNLLHVFFRHISWDLSLHGIRDIAGAEVIESGRAGASWVVRKGTYQNLESMRDDRKAGWRFLRLKRLFGATPIPRKLKTLTEENHLMYHSITSIFKERTTHPYLTYPKAPEPKSTTQTTNSATPKTTKTVHPRARVSKSSNCSGPVSVLALCWMVRIRSLSRFQSRDRTMRKRD